MPKENVFQKYAGYQVPAEVQARLNQPLPTARGLNEKERAFLKDVMARLKSHELNTLKTASLFKKEPNDQATAEAMGLMGLLRQMERLILNGQIETYQMENLVRAAFLAKSRAEEKYGDIFVL